MLCRRLKRQVRRERIRHGLSKPKQGGRLLVKKRSFWRFLRKPLKPFEDRCPRIEASWTRNIFGLSFFRPSGACVVSVLYPRLAPWAAFFRRLAALQFHANLDARQACDLLPRNKRAAFARRARIPLSAKEEAPRSG